MRLDEEEESRNVEDRRANSSGGGRMDMRTMMMLWPLIRPLLRSKLGLLLIGAGVAAYTNRLMRNGLCSLKKY